MELYNKISLSIENRLKDIPLTKPTGELELEVEFPKPTPGTGVLKKIAIVRYSRNIFNQGFKYEIVEYKDPII